jgi:hypothetical protein
MVDFGFGNEESELVAGVRGQRSEARWQMMKDEERCLNEIFCFLSS